MKSFLIIPLTISLTSCATLLAPSSAVTTNALAAFENICLKTAPNFSDAEKIAKNYGVTEFMALGPMKLGDSVQGYNVQIEENKECAVVFDRQDDLSITTKVLKLAQKYSSIKINKITPTPIVIQGQRFIVGYNRKDGEALVLLKSGS